MTLDEVDDDVYILYIACHYIYFFLSPANACGYPWLCREMSTLGKTEEQAGGTAKSSAHHCLQCTIIR